LFFIGQRKLNALARRLQHRRTTDPVTVPSSPKVFDVDNDLFAHLDAAL